MQFNPPLIETKLIKRYKRFLADVQMPDGEMITVHCANPGSMMGLTEPGNRAWISDSQNPKRKLRYSLEILEVNGVMVGINTNHPNKLAREVIENGLIPELSDFDEIQTEVKYGKNSRIDILLKKEGAKDTFVEVKNVHFVRTPGVHEFPDSVTARGAKHLMEMANEVNAGNRAAMVYIIQRNDGDIFKLSQDLDPEYAKAFRYAASQGVEAYAICCDVRTDGIDAVKPVTLEIT